MSTNLTNASITSTGTSAVTRTFHSRMSDVINVLDYGADPTGGSDSTNAIQAALNAAFGANFGSSFNGNPYTNSYKNRPVYFPGGTYLVTSPNATTTVSSVSTDNAGGAGLGHLTYGLTSTHAYSVGQTVFVEGAAGYTFSDPINRTVEITAVTSYQFTAGNSMVSFTNGDYGSSQGGTVHSAALVVKGVYGGHLYGSGKQWAQILDGRSGGIAFLANGFKGSRVEGLNFSGNGVTPYAGFVMDLEAGTSPGIQGVAYNSLNDCMFNGCTVGIHVGPTTGSQGDTISFYNCIFESDSDGAVIGAHGANTLNISFYGGIFNTCGTGIVGQYGTVGVISGTLFTANSLDIFCNFAAPQTIDISGVRTESANFIYLTHGCAHLSGVVQDQQSSGSFCISAYPVTMYDCMSTAGEIKLQSGGTIIGSQFNSSRAISIDDANYNLYPIRIENCYIGAMPFGPYYTNNIQTPNFISGIAQNVGTTNYFIGRKRAVTTGPGSSIVYTDQIAADLPSSGNINPPSGPSFKGMVTTIMDSTTGTVGTVITSSMGGGTIAATVLCDGTSSGWKIIGS